MKDHKIDTSMDTQIVHDRFLHMLGVVSCEYEVCDVGVLVEEAKGQAMENLLSNIRNNRK